VAPKRSQISRVKTTNRTAAGNSPAKQRFAAQGYEKTTLREVAADAHVDPSMVLFVRVQGRALP
jgi:Bacterial regulatory proteins, tetR family